MLPEISHAAQRFPPIESIARSPQIRREEISGVDEYARTVPAKYPAGSSLRVYYNPSNATDAVVENNPAGGVVILWLLALGLFAVGAWVWGYLHRS